MVAKICVFVFFCIWCVQLSHQKPEQCLRAPDAGPCMAKIPRLYYEAASNSCKEFFYGGCSSNGNNFETIEDCDSVCVIETKTAISGDRCNLNPEIGNCKASIQRTYYDTDTNSCKVFTYGGCGGNDNNFNTTEQCQAACVKDTTGASRCFLKPETGLCKARIPRLFYDTESNTCKEFIYGGCGGNTNNFESLQECDQACVSMARYKSNTCYLPKMEGPCKMTIPRQYYDSDENKCKEFIYGGCGGNGNNFEMLEDCESKCVITSTCYQTKKEGPCKMNIPRLYYDSDENECKEFIYGGCEGNDNNFEKLMDCKSTCVKNVSASTCYLPKMEGPCKMNIPRLYYDINENKCKEFTYGGCEGNDNNFERLALCERTCVKSDSDNVCDLPAEKGNCRGMLTRFYYNSITQTCGEFYYGGCGGNNNNFESEEECNLKCDNAAPISTVTNLHILIVCLPLILTRLWF